MPAGEVVVAHQGENPCCVANELSFCLEVGCLEEFLKVMEGSFRCGGGRDGFGLQFQQAGGGKWLVFFG